MVEVKICGVCRPEDAREAAAAGARWLGVILAPDRTRSRTRSQARAILDAGAVRRVGVFVDAMPVEVTSAAHELELDAVQLHGAEDAAAIERIRDTFHGEVWKAIRVRNAADVVRGAALYAERVDALLLDGFAENAHGGAGARFDWRAIAESDARPRSIRLVVAGGLTPDNVADAIALLDPAVVDVSSGVESAPGVKAPDRIRAFIDAAHGVRRA